MTFTFIVTIMVFHFTLLFSKSKLISTSFVTTCFKGCTAPKTCCILCNEVVRGPCHFIYTVAMNGKTLNLTLTYKVFANSMCVLGFIQANGRQFMSISVQLGLFLGIKKNGGPTRSVGFYRAEFFRLRFFRITIWKKAVSFTVGIRLSARLGTKIFRQSDLAHNRDTYL